MPLVDIDVDRVESNIILWHLKAEAPPVVTVLARLKEAGFIVGGMKGASEPTIPTHIFWNTDEDDDDDDDQADNLQVWGCWVAVCVTHQATMKLAATCCRWHSSCDACGCDEGGLPGIHTCDARRTGGRAVTCAAALPHVLCVTTAEPCVLCESEPEPCSVPFWWRDGRLNFVVHCTVCVLSR